MKSLLFFLIAVIAGLLWLAPSTVFAHERQVFKIGTTQYVFIVGSLNEPIFVDDKTGVDLRIKTADPQKPEDSNAPNAKPVTGLESSLKVEISAGSKKKTFDLEPAFNDPGAYRAPFYPTVQTTYSYRLFGTVNTVPVDVSFECNPAGHPQSPEDRSEVKISDQVTRTFKAGAFGCPKAKVEAGFPEPSATLADLAKIKPSASTGAASYPVDDASISLMESLAIALGALGFLFGLIALARGKKSM